MRGGRPSVSGQPYDAPVRVMVGNVSGGAGIFPDDAGLEYLDCRTGEDEVYFGPPFRGKLSEIVVSVGRSFL